MGKQKSAKHSNARHNSSSNNDHFKCARMILPFIFAALLSVTLLFLGLKLLHGNEDGADLNRRMKQESFLKWIVDNGGIFHPIQHGDEILNVRLEEFPEFGGWGLALAFNFDTSQNEQCLSSSMEQQCQLNENGSESSPVVKEFDPLFTIPTSLIITIPHIFEMYASTSSPYYIVTFYSQLHSILQQYLHGNGLSKQINDMGLVEQDVILALYLMVENCQHDNVHLFRKDSFYGPYLDVLPGLIPRLDTFGDEEYEALNDEVLEEMGRESKRLLETMYNGIDGRKAVRLKNILLDMIASKLKSGSVDDFEAISCTSFDSFHRFVSIISSRAMLLHGEKRLVPLAEMINYAPLPEVSSNHIRPSFELFHTLGDDGSMTIRSDRDVFLESGSISFVQLFEDYGPVDSSLFLEAHGFVPHKNAHHCAVMPGSLMVGIIAPNGIEEEDQQWIRHALRRDPAYFTPLLQDVCIRQDFTLIEDGNFIGRRPASDAIALVSLFNGDNSTLSLKERCIHALLSHDAELIEIRCFRYPESLKVINGVLRNTAAAIVSEGFDLDNNKKDLEMSTLVSNLKDAEANGRDRTALAWRFRIEERRLLISIAFPSATQMVEKQHIEEIVDDSDMQLKLLHFNSFIESLQLPINNLEPRIIGDGMRLGAYAKENVEEGDVYLSFPLNTTIDYDNAILNAPPELSLLLQKFDNMSKDSFMVIYLIYERFVMKERSKWWPYLNLLPTVEEVKASHPLFYTVEDIDQHLAGSSVRKMLLLYQQQTTEKHITLALDVDATHVLGSKIIRDMNIFRWASAMIDSRSIWWNGRRHLAPLLDLVNGDTNGKPHETRVESSIAVTKASRHVQAGEQLLENYGQPNYLLFMYQGFILENNPHDCALFDHNKAQNVNTQMQHVSSTFCISEKPESLAELATVLRMDPMQGNDEDVRPYLKHLLEERVSRLRDVVDSFNDFEQMTPYHIYCMHQLVRNDLEHFENALKLF